MSSFSPSPQPTPTGAESSSAPKAETPVETKPPTQRLRSLDAYRGFTMLFMALNTGRWLDIAKEFPNSQVWAFLYDQLEHRPWGGNTMWDMIQPSFMFMVGVSLPYSAAKRLSLGQPYWRLFLHAVIRSAILIFLGVFLRSQRYLSLNWTLIDVLAQIGLGYTFLFLLWNRPIKVQLGTLVLILVGYWSFFAFWPLPDENFDQASWNISEKTADRTFDGFAAHWNYNANPGAYFDRWFYNQLPRPLDQEGNSIGPYLHDRGGYALLNFVPALGTMILGLLVGGLLRSERSDKAKMLRLILFGAGLIAVGWLLDFSGVCPIVKRIWTPSWVLFSGGFCFWILAAFYTVMDIAGFWRWAFPGIVVGLNPIVLYVLNGTLSAWAVDRIQTVFGRDVYKIFGAVYEPLVAQLAALLLFWLICFWMYRRKFFIRI